MYNNIMQCYGGFGHMAAVGKPNPVIDMEYGSVFVWHIYTYEYSYAQRSDSMKCPNYNRQNYNYLFICLFIYLFIYLSIDLFIYLSIYLFILQMHQGTIQSNDDNNLYNHCGSSSGEQTSVSNGFVLAAKWMPFIQRELLKNSHRAYNNNSIEFLFTDSDHVARITGPSRKHVFTVFRVDLSMALIKSCHFYCANVFECHSLLRIFVGA